MVDATTPPPQRMQQQPQLQLDDPHSLHLNNPTSTGESIDPPSTLSPHINHTPITTSTPTTSVLPLYLATGATLLTAGVAFGIRLGNRQAAQIEADNPPPPATSTRTTARPPPPITPQQRAAAFRATLGALGLGTVLCGALGVGLVWGMGRWLDVGDTKAFAVRMDRVVSEQRVRWLGSMTSSLPSQVAGLRTSLGSTQLGGWIRDKGKVAGSEQHGEGEELSPQESVEVEQAAAFLKELEVDYQRTVADMRKRRQARAEVAEIDKARKT